MQQYLDLLRHIVTTGRARGDRTGTGTISVFGAQLRFDLQEGFPLVSAKRTPFHLVIAELLWFLEGSTDNLRLRELSGVEEGKRGIWDDWAPERDDIFENTVGDVVDMRKLQKLGPIYGKQWRKWDTGVLDAFETDSGPIVSRDHSDQLCDLIDGLKHNPYSRRHIVSAWNVADLPDETIKPKQNVIAGKMALAPCHTMFQCYVRNMTLEERVAYHNSRPENAGIMLGIPNDIDVDASMEMLDKLSIPKCFLDLQLYQRSLDAPIGGPFNIASYALLMHMLAKECGYVPGDFVWTIGDAHVYQNQLAEVGVMLSRDVKPMPSFSLPDDFNLNQVLGSMSDRALVLRLAEGLSGYDPHPPIRMAVAV